MFPEIWGWSKKGRPPGRRAVEAMLGDQGTELWLELHENSGKRGQRHGQGVVAAHVTVFFGVDTAHVAQVGATVDAGVRIQHFLVETGARDANTVAGAGNRCRVHNHEHDVVGVLATSDE